jgi:hypothetical protein
MVDKAYDSTEKRSNLESDKHTCYYAAWFATEINAGVTMTMPD